MIVPHGYLVKVDLARAYRVVKVHQSNYTALGLKYVFIPTQPAFTTPGSPLN